MKEKHPIDKLFTEGFNDADIPFDEGAWTALSRKMHRRRRWPLIIGIGSIAAAVVIAVLLLFGDREQQTINLRQRAALQQKQPVAMPPVTPPTTGSVQPDNWSEPLTAVSAQSPAHESHHRLSSGRLPALTYVQRKKVIAEVKPADLRARPHSIATKSIAQPFQIHSESADYPRTATVETRQHTWSLGIIAAPDLSGMHAFRGKLSGNIGLTATYRVNGWFSITAGALYAKKLYQADFADYRPGGNPVYTQYTPITVNADCDVLDIPVNINIDIIRKHRGTLFASTGLSSYLMLREAYDYNYPPHQYGDMKQLTLHNENRHILGLANLSIGYRRRLGDAVSITVQPFVKVPLTGIGNGKLKLYSSGVALSADIDLTPRTKR
ncbi:MAG TPA: hypothetical protein VNQ55_06500 [Parapedobacter sp.]|nr:hypothetical protein [Parapedobacter sp.]